MGVTEGVEVREGGCDAACDGVRVGIERRGGHGRGTARLGLGRDGVQHLEQRAEETKLHHQHRLPEQRRVLVRLLFLLLPLLVLLGECIDTGRGGLPAHADAAHDVRVHERARERELACKALGRSLVVEDLHGDLLAAVHAAVHRRERAAAHRLPHVELGRVHTRRGHAGAEARALPLLQHSHALVGALHARRTAAPKHREHTHVAAVNAVPAPGHTLDLLAQHNPNLTPTFIFTHPSINQQILPSC